MRIKPGTLDHIISIISEWPEQMKREALKVVVEEHKRLERSDYTSEEKTLFKRAGEMGMAAATARE